MQYNYHIPRVQKVIHYHYHYNSNDLMNQSAHVISPDTYSQRCQNSQQNQYQQNFNKQSCKDLQYWKMYKNPQINTKYSQLSGRRDRINTFSQSQVNYNQQIHRDLYTNYKLTKNLKQFQAKNHKNQKKIKIKIHPLDKKFVNNEIQKYQQYLDRFKQKNYSVYSNYLNGNINKNNQKDKENYINLRQRPQSTISFKKQSENQFDDQHNLAVSRAHSYLFTQRHQKNQQLQQNQQGSLLLNTSQKFYHTQRSHNKSPQIATSKFFDSKDLRMTAQTNFSSTCQSGVSFQQNRKLFSKKSKELNERPTYQATQSSYLNLKSTQQKEDLQYKYNLLKQQCTYLRQKFVTHFKKVHKKKF